MYFLYFYDSLYICVCVVRVYVCETMLQLFALRIIQDDPEQTHSCLCS